MHGNSIAALHLTLLHCIIVNELLRLVFRRVVAGTMAALTGGVAFAAVKAGGELKLVSDAWPRG